MATKVSRRLCRLTEKTLLNVGGISNLLQNCECKSPETIKHTLLENSQILEGIYI